MESVHSSKTVTKTRYCGSKASYSSLASFFSHNHPWTSKAWLRTVRYSHILIRRMMARYVLWCHRSLFHLDQGSHHCRASWGHQEPTSHSYSPWLPQPLAPTTCCPFSVFLSVFLSVSRLLVLQSVVLFVFVFILIFVFSVLSFVLFMF